MMCRSPHEAVSCCLTHSVGSNILERSHLLSGLLGGLVSGLLGGLVGGLLGGLVGGLLGGLVGGLLGGLVGGLLGGLVAGLLGGLVGGLLGGLVGGLQGSQGDVVAKLLQTLNSTAFDPGSIQLIKVIPT